MTLAPSYRRILTRMGYYNYQSGLIYRHISQDGAWETHQQHSRNFILKAIELLKPEKVTVLGSGWLLDFPIAEVVDRVHSVSLVDIIHPPDVIRQVAAWKNVDLIEQDVTGGLIEEVWNKTRKYSYLYRLKTLNNINIPDIGFKDDPGLVISLNILTQLESQLLVFVRKRSKISSSEIDSFRRRIQEKHIQFLLKHKSVLITDYEEVITSRAGGDTIVPTLYCGLPQGRINEKWIWSFDQTGVDLINSKSVFRIAASLYY